MRVLAVVAFMFAAGQFAAAETVPLPRERPHSLLERFGLPPQNPPSTSAPPSLAPAPELQGVVRPPAMPGPSVCQTRLTEVAVHAPLPALSGPGDCRANDVVRLDAIKLPNRTTISLNPPAVVRCTLAEAVAHWVRDDVAPAAASVLGSGISAIVNYDSYSCRGRNRVVGAKLSEHGRANALDIRAFRLASGALIEPTDPQVAKPFRDAMRRSACARFMTVLGPGSDGYHENHVHVDLAERVRGYRMCQWDLHEPPAVASVPLPLPRPLADAKSR